jgi:glycogen debranching enzyme
VLNTQDDQRAEFAFAQLHDPSAFGGRFGPRSVHVAEPSFDPEGYWRGTVWPQLNYLFWVAARRHGQEELATWLAERSVRVVLNQGFPEYWKPDTGAGLGAIPQSWATLVLAMTSRERPGH